MSDDIATAEFVLVGPHAGKTKTFGPRAQNMMTKNFEFVDGVYTRTAAESELTKLAIYLRKSYQAYRRGPALEAAQAAWDAEHGEQKPAPKPTRAKKQSGNNNETPATAEAITAALQLLDGENDDHWNSRNQPSVDAVVELLGGPVTRKQIEEANPGFTRPTGD